MEKFIVPPYTRATFRSDSPFTVWDGDEIVGPNTATDRIFVVETAEEEMDLEISTEGRVTMNGQIRPSPFESNDGVPVAISSEIAPPTIQDMIRMYIREATENDDPGLETPEEFFDFGEDEDDDGHLLNSPYEYEYLDDEYPLPQEGDSSESPPETASEARTDAQTNTPTSPIAEPAFESRRDSQTPAPSRAAKSDHPSEPYNETRQQQAG